MNPRSAIKKRLRDRARAAFKKRGMPVPNLPSFDRVTSSLMASLPRRWQEYEIDHVVPLRLFDFSDDCQLRAAFSPENHQWMDPGMNHSKQANFETRKLFELLQKYSEERE